MFYSLSLLSRKGPLGTIWIAAYCFKKLKRGQIDSTDISSTVDKIMPEIEISHRVLAQLLLGIVKIFSKKVDFLYNECNETLNLMRRSLPPIQRIAQIKASALPTKDIKGRKAVKSSIDDIAKKIMEHATEQHIEKILASYHEVTVTLPEHFELDSFDLGTLDDGDDGKSLQQCTPLDEWKGNRSSRASNLVECPTNDVVNLSDYKSSCFTPLADILDSSVMDVDLEQTYGHDNSSNFPSVQRSLEKFHNEEEIQKRVCLTGNMAIHNEIQESHMQLNYEQIVPSVRDDILLIEEQGDLTEISNLQGKNVSSMMNVDIEISETHKSSNFASVRKSHEEFHPGEMFEKQVFLDRCVSSHDLIRESHITFNYEQMEPAIDDQNLPVEEPRKLKEMINLQEELLSGCRKNNSIALPLDEQKSNISGKASPKFMIATPAIKESSRVLRKRKKRKRNDESINLSNEVMRQSINDASDLICKRRKLPHTKLDIWKLWRFSNLSQSFTDPLIPFSSPESEKLPQEKLYQLSRKSADGLIESTNVKDGSPHKSSNTEMETEDLIKKLDEMPEHSVQKMGEISHSLLKESAGDHNDPMNMEDSTPHINTASEKRVLMQKVEITCLTPSKSSDCRTNSLENVSKEFFSTDAIDCQLEVMELCFRGDNVIEQDDRWSPSTREAAQYLYKRFQRLREQKQDLVLSLLEILEGKTRATCARLIYETLNLKTYGCIDVTQDFPYGDVSVSATPVLESFHKDFV